MTGDATEAYPRDLGLKRYMRHVLFVKPDVLLVCDEAYENNEILITHHWSSGNWSTATNHFQFSLQVHCEICGNYGDSVFIPFQLREACFIRELQRAPKGCN